ncbi:MAG: phosphoenolpyruvate carboxykinase [Acidobacteriota bacterium]
MSTVEIIGRGKSHYGLEHHGLTNQKAIYWNSATEVLYEEAIKRGEGLLAHDGALVVRTGRHTGRSAKDKYIVRNEESESRVWWENNAAIPQSVFDALYLRVSAYLQNRDVFVQDCYAGADPRYRVPIRVVTETAWHALFARTLFLREYEATKLAQHIPEFTVIHVPSFLAIPEIDGTKSPTFVVLDFARKLVLIGGTHYAGEIKKSIFTLMNYVLPQRGVLSMHCSANYGKGKDDTAIFFGLSGTGKTTLSADSTRTLIGDDEHGWSDNGVFNIEGGCYAKMIRLSPIGEPEIFAATRHFGTVLENVVLDEHSRVLDLDDASITENTRGAYPVTQIANMTRDGLGGIPRHIVMLTCDAFGVLPPIARLTSEQAMYHYISGYTAKVAGTEMGVTEPVATFSACFGAPFLPLHPSVYAKMLGEKIAQHKVKIWLLNTGWTGGPYGIGERMSLSYTRAILHAALDGHLDQVEYTKNPVFGFEIPTTCPNVPENILNPRNTWEDKAAFDAQEKRLAAMFIRNFAKFESMVEANICAAGPRL